MNDLNRLSKHSTGAFVSKKIVFSYDNVKFDTMIRAALLFVLNTLLLIPFFAQENWELERDEEGIVIHTRNIEGSGFKEYKAEASMEGSLDDFISIIRDVDDYPEVFSNVESARILESTDSSLTYYMTSDAPWPVRDRDAITRLTIDKGVSNLVINVSSKPEYLDELDGYVRIEETRGSWNVKVVEDGTLNIQLQMHAEPGGSIPSWLSNRVIVDGPFEDFQNIRKLLKED